MALRTPTVEADEIKLRFGIAKQVLADPVEKIDVPGLGERAPRTLSRQALAAVIEPRIEELFSLVHQVIRESGYEELLSSGVVLTGGTSLLPGMVELAEDIFLKPVRIGMPAYTGGLADVVDQPIEPEHVLANDVEQLLAQRRVLDFVEAVDGTAQRSEGVLQLVGDIGRERLDIVDAVSQGLAHVRDRPRQRPDLIAARRQARHLDLPGTAEADAMSGQRNPP